MKKGKVSLEFAILKNGRVAGLHFVNISGDSSLDRAAYNSILASNPFPPLPAEFRGSCLTLRMRFFYNPDEDELTAEGASQPSRSGTAVSIFPYHSLKVPVGGSEVLTASVKGTTNPAVKWTVTGSGCSGSACGTIVGGLYLAPDALPTPPRVTVTATSEADPTAWASVTVQIVQLNPSR
jgi:TonB family protein